MGYKQDDLDVAAKFQRVKVIKEGVLGERPQFEYTTQYPNPTRWRVWISGYNPKRPWRTAKIEKVKNSFGHELDCYTTHAGHATLQAAFEWLEALD